ncbi:MAG: GlsB/YeaQ/YmgE family stress response membrane protein [Sphingomonadaceae bacterium]
MAYGFFGWIIVGLLAGALAKLLHPGRDPGGIGVTMLVGIAGGVLGGLFAGWLDLPLGGLALDLAIATGGALLLLIAWRALDQRRSS